jgi:hypothetical protein
MYEDSPFFELHVDRSTRIWRYTDFTKFLSLLERRALFFSRACVLGDAFEGTYTSGSWKYLEENWRNFSEQQREGFRLGWKCSSQDNRRTIVVNCWHMNDYESAAMWRLYVTGNEGVAVQSTVDRLCQSFIRCPHPPQHVAPIRYIDYGGDEVISPDNVFSPFLYKRKSFEHEREIRAISWTEYGKTIENPSPCGSNETLGGLCVPIDVGTLIERIFVSPTAPSWYLELVQSIVKRYGLDAELKQSSLTEGPIY